MMEAVGAQRFEKEIVGEVWTSPGVYARLGKLHDCGSRFAGAVATRLARAI